MVRQSIRILLLAGAITATASTIQEDAEAALYAGPPQSISVQSLSQPVSDAARSQIAPFGFWPKPALQEALPLLPASEPWLALKTYGYRPQTLFYGYPDRDRVEPNTVPSQPVAIEPPLQVERSRPLPRPAPLGEALRKSSEPIVREPIVRIAFSASVLGPMAHTRFCLAYPGECKVHRMVFRGGAIKLNAERRAELTKVNAEVNRAITPEPNTEGLAAEKWLIAPKSGECHDYAVTKRHELIARGWPARALLLAEVVVASGEHHLVLVVRTHAGDLVADNLNGNIRNWSKTHYQWVRIQTPANPLYWATVARTTVYAQLR